MLIPGVFSFIIGVIGLFGGKYLKAVMLMVIVVLCMTISKLILNYHFEPDLEGLYGVQIAYFFIGFNIF